MAAFCLALVSSATARSQTVDVTAHVQFSHEASGTKIAPMNSPPVVLWLTPLDTAAHPVEPRKFRLVQKDKMFRPHMLVVPVGSEVTFPNLDPFFHNVFSLFNGKRFDLGLYQMGDSKEVHFNHEGVSFIFCNIHPEMSAVVIVLSTPYFAVSAADGTVLVHDVPAGNYQINVWSEGIDNEQLSALSHEVSIRGGHTDLGAMRLVNDVNRLSHKNKFGQDYSSDPVIY